MVEWGQEFIVIPEYGSDKCVKRSDEYGRKEECQA